MTTDNEGKNTQEIQGGGGIELQITSKVTRKSRGAERLPV